MNAAYRRTFFFLFSLGGSFYIAFFFSTPPSPTHKCLKRHDFEKLLISLGFISAEVIRKGIQEGGRNSVATVRGLAGMEAELPFPGLTPWPDYCRVHLRCFITVLTT